MSRIFCRCTLPRLQLLNFEVAPELDLQVTPTSKDCLVKMLSCKVSYSRGDPTPCVRGKLHLACICLRFIHLFNFRGIYMHVSFTIQTTFKISHFPLESNNALSLSNKLKQVYIWNNPSLCTLVFVTWSTNSNHLAKFC